jgi:galactokinase
MPIRKQPLDIELRISELFRNKFGHAHAYRGRAPGRVNLLGEHVDYNDGFVLPAAIDRATYIAFSPADSENTTLWAADFDGMASFSAQTLNSKTQLDGSPLPAWAKYPAGVAWALSNKDLAIKGMNAVFTSEVPRGAGLSSSASVELSFAIAWMNLGGWQLPPMELALLCQKAENQYVGVNCGIMDQFAAACGEKDRLLVLDCRTLEYRSLPLPDRVVVVIADTTVRHSHTTSAYNDRRAACEEAVRILNQVLPGIRSLRDVSIADFEKYSSRLPSEVEMRARHVVEEIDRTERAVKLLESGDVTGFGRLMNACHISLRDLYEVSCPESDTMVRIAQSIEGCYGARQTGGGFGGCTVNLVEREKAQNFVKSLATEYISQTGLHPEIYICAASAGASILYPP